MSSTSDAMRELEVFEVLHAEGPCVDCFASGVAISVDLRDPAAADRWPAFAARARAASVTGVQALPMRLRDDTIGALNIFHTAERRLGEHDTALAQALADIATIAILQRRALTSSELLSEQLQAALNDRIVIEQAKGLLAERGGLAVGEAFTLLRNYCRAERLPLTRTARALVTGERDPDDVLAQRWPSSLI
jgi:GAF domain-containing protein